MLEEELKLRLVSVFQGSTHKDQENDLLEPPRGAQDTNYVSCYKQNCQEKRDSESMPTNKYDFVSNWRRTGKPKDRLLRRSYVALLKY